MYTANKTTKTHRKPECCTDLKCGTGLRNNYFEGKRLTADSFRVEQDYMVQRRRLLNRAIHGWGVVYGYGIDPHTPGSDCNDIPPGSLKIHAGLALDKCGRELLETGRAIKISDLIIFDRNGERVDDLSADECWLLSVHYAEQDTGPVTVEDSCRCKYHEWDHTCETVRYSLKPVPCDDCCREWDCELECDCGTGPCCDDTGEYYDKHKECKRQQRGGCRCICDHLINLNPRGECEHLCEIEGPCGTVRVDIGNGVPLACINVVSDYDNCWAFGTDLEVCGPRRLVKRNDLLFDLIRGCDLTRIIEIGWADWHRREDPITFDQFSDAFGPVVEHKLGYVSNKFWVRFSRPVRTNTLRPDCFAMTVLSAEDEGGWWVVFRVPIVNVDTTAFPSQAGDPPGHVRGAAIVVDGPWLEDAVRGRRTIFQDGETRVEFEVRGDLIVDCNGQTVDANSFGLCPAPSGNATAGGTLLSTFKVEPAREMSRRGPNYGGNPKESRYE